jgi:hypothetical protein
VLQPLAPLITRTSRERASPQSTFTYTLGTESHHHQLRSVVPCTAAKTGCVQNSVEARVSRAKKFRYRIPRDPPSQLTRRRLRINVLCEDDDIEHHEHAGDDACDYDEGNVNHSTTEFGVAQQDG